MSNPKIRVDNPSIGDDEERAMRMLATELARDIRDPLDIIAGFGLTERDYDALSKTRRFQAMLAGASKDWAAAENTPERIKLQSMVLIEEALPKLFQELTNKENTLTSRADLFGRIAKIGGLGNAPPAKDHSGEQFSIVINLGSDKAPVIIQQDLPPRVTDDYEDL
jgi:hypothetical protein